jgi:hypothetical protein
MWSVAEAKMQRANRIDSCALGANAVESIACGYLAARFVPDSPLEESGFELSVPS